MFIQPIIFIFLILSIFILCLVIYFMIHSYNRLLKRIDQEEQEKISAYQNMNDKAGIILAETHKKQLEVLEEGKKKVQEMLDGTKDFDNKTQEQMKSNLDAIVKNQQKVLEQIVDEQTASLKNQADSIRQEDINTLKTIEERIESTIDSDLEKFTKDLEQETLGVEEKMQDKANQDYQSIASELEEYKKKQYAKIQENIFPLVKSISVQLIGKSLNPKDHEDLVIQAIEDSQKQFSTS